MRSPLRHLTLCALARVFVAADGGQSPAGTNMRNNDTSPFAAAGGGSGALSNGADWVSLDPVPTPWPIIVEAENFSFNEGGAATGWQVTAWGQDHYYGATFSNTFASRKALIHALPSAKDVATSPPVTIPTAGVWYVCVRYEAAYRFETQFTVVVKQQGGPKLTKLYGTRAANKIWSFGFSLRNHEIAGCGANPTPECHWTWGATENWVWEYYPVTLCVHVARRAQARCAHRCPGSVAHAAF
jgi:hypothetical protein